MKKRSPKKKSPRTVHHVVTPPRDKQLDDLIAVLGKLATTYSRDIERRIKRDVVNDKRIEEYMTFLPAIVQTIMGGKRNADA